jgi:hypothetical protein
MSINYLLIALLSRFKAATINYEFFVNLVEDKDGTAILWFRRQLAKLT